MDTWVSSGRFELVVDDGRSSVGFSSKKLAGRAALHPTYVSMVERAVRKPTLEACARIAKALKVSLPRLIEEAQHQRGNRTNRRLICQP
jgi:transcriptional regulator with XRE-family HTH domain